MLSTRGRGALVGLMAAGTFAVLPVGVAAAEPHGVISAVVPGADDLAVEFVGRDLRADDRLETGTLRAFLDGREVEVTADEHTSTHAPELARRVALVVDTSGSMAGAPLAAARSAAKAYLETVPGDVEVALISFAKDAEVIATPTRDRGRVAEALSGLTAQGGTSLYDAVLTARDTLGGKGQRRVVVLSDGADSDSVTSLTDAAATVQEAGLGVDVVALGEAPAEAALARLAQSGGGQLLRASDDVDAVAAFQAAAQAFTSALRLDVSLPSQAEAGGAMLEVRVTTTDGHAVSATSPVVLPAGATGAGLLSTKAAQVGGLLAVFVGLASALVLAVRSGDTEAVGRRRTEQVLSAYTLRGPSAGAPVETPSRIGSGVLARAALAVAGRVLDRGERERRLTLKLERAGVRFTAREWLVVQGLVVVGVLLPVLLVLHAVLALLAAGAAAVALRVWLSLKGARRASAFEAEMPDALQLVASGLSTGYSLPQALDSVVNEGRPPMAEELGRALAEARLGVPMETALDNVADRLDSNDFRWVVMAIRVQRDVGGNLSEVLTTLCQTMRERGALRRQIRALSAEGRLGALILILLPVFVVAYLSLFNYDFFRPMWETTLGHTLMGGSVVALGLGALWMKQLIKVEA